MPEVADPALIGRRVAGKFVVERFIGGGAMGAVYRARDASLERNVALKVMHPEMAVDPTFVSRFHREAKAASRLDHPSSVRVIEFGEEPDGLLYIAMEYLEGRDLDRVIHEDWPLSEDRIADITMKALAAIGVAHEMGVIHRDLKPENIMILDRKDDEDKDMVKVCDFGIAKITDSDSDGAPRAGGVKVTTAGLVVGTPEYMSPEQARGEPLDSRSDLYSMGIILYQLLTGRTPFLGETPLAVVLKHITDEPALPRTIYPDVLPALEAVCMRALEKDRDARFQNARDMRAAIKAAVDGVSLSSQPAAGHVTVSSAARGEVPDARAASRSPVERSRPRRSRWPLVLLVVVALAGGAAAVYVRGMTDVPAGAAPSASESAMAFKIHPKASGSAVAPSSASGSARLDTRGQRKVPAPTKVVPHLPSPSSEPFEAPSSPSESATSIDWAPSLPASSGGASSSERR